MISRQARETGQPHRVRRKSPSQIPVSINRQVGQFLRGTDFVNTPLTNGMELDKRILNSLLLALGLIFGGAQAGAVCSLYVTRISADAELHLEPNQVAIFAYGSLLNLESLNRTLNTSYEGTLKLARLAGWERTWTALYPNNNRYRANQPEPVWPKDILYYNIEPSPLATINGAVIVVTEEQAKLVDQREFPYDRRDVTESIQGLRVTGGRVYTYVAKPEFTARGDVRFPDVGVRETYTDMVNVVLPHFGPEFHDEFRSSTRPVPDGTLFWDVAD